MAKGQEAVRVVSILMNARKRIALATANCAVQQP